MKIVNINGRNLVTQHIYPVSEIKAGSVWAPADESNYTVTVVSVGDGWVTYKDDRNHVYDKFALAFQSRYCLVVDDSPTVDDEPTKTFTVKIRCSAVREIEVEAKSLVEATVLAHRQFARSASDWADSEYHQETISAEEKA